MRSRTYKRPMLLLEVLIALSLIILCAIPLLAPQGMLLRQQFIQISQIELDHLVNLIYVETLALMYRGEITWGEVQEQKTFPIDSTLLERVGYKKPLPYEATYKFSSQRSKGNQQGIRVEEVLLTFRFVPKAPHQQTQSSPGTPAVRPIEYSYLLTIGHFTPPIAPSEKNTSSASKKDKKTPKESSAK